MYDERNHLRDQLPSSTIAGLSPVVLAISARIPGVPPGEQVMATAVAFRTMLGMVLLDPLDVMRLVAELEHAPSARDFQRALRTKLRDDFRCSPALAKDQFGLTDISRLRPAAFSIIDRIQGVSPGVQVMAVAVALRELVRNFEMDLSQVMGGAWRAAQDADAAFTSHMEAIKQYAKHELLEKQIEPARHGN